MTPNEKRKAPRRKVQIPVICGETEEQMHAGKGMEIVTKDLSGHGMAFFSHQIYSIGSDLFTDLYLPNQKKPISCKIHIVSVEALLHKKEYLIGASFLEMDAEDRRKIAMALEKLDLYVLLQSAVTGGASDLHLTVGRPPMVRRGGRILTMAAEVIEPGQVEAMLYPLLSRKQILFFEKNKEIDFAFSPDINSRFRVNMHFQKGYVEAVLRNIPTEIRSFSELGLPEETMQRLCQETSGLFLIAGTTGSGKTTTMMSMVEYINQTLERVIVTIEDPIEHTLRGQKSIIKQRELGSDTLSYAGALKHVLRQDPDVVCVGEILDEAGLFDAIRTAETGRLVISTVRASSTISALEHMIHFVPPEHAATVRQQLSSCLLGILYQSLLPRKQGGYVAGTELMLNNTAMKNLIREGRYNFMDNIIQTGRAQGMYKFQDNLQELYQQELIDQAVIENFIKEENS